MEKASVFLDILTASFVGLTHLKEECESDPLVICHVSPLVLLIVRAGHDTGVRHVATHVQGEGTWYRVRRVDPAIQVEHIVRDVLKNIFMSKVFFSEDNKHKTCLKL